MSLYLDASVLVALLTHDLLTSRAETLLRDHPQPLIVSDFAAAEFASALGRRVRSRELTADEARSAVATLDLWAARASQRVETTPRDVAVASAFLRRFDLTLRTPDALNIAIAERCGAALATFDVKMAAAARGLNLAAPGPVGA